MKKNRKFRPMLITNDPIPSDVPYKGRILSIKRHGIRVIFLPYEDKILGRSLKPIKNIQFQERFRAVLEYCKMHNIMLEGEAHIDGTISDDMTHFLNTIDLNDINATAKKKIREHIESGKFHLPEEKYYSLPQEMRIYLFDILIGRPDGTFFTDMPFAERYNRLFSVEYPLSGYVKIIPQIPIQTKENSDDIYRVSLENGFEGVVVKFNKPYKYGRTTAKEQIGYKMLPVPTFDGKIIAVNQATVVDPHAEKKINELGYSVTSKKKDDRIPIEKAKDFQVRIIPEGKTEAVEFGVSMKGFDDEARKRVWVNKEQYIGRWIEFKCKEYNGLGKPKSASFIRFRDDK